MTTEARNLRTAALGTLAAVLTAGTLAAQPRRPGPGRPQGARLNLMQGLQLTGEQRQAIRALLDERRASADSETAHTRDLRQQLKSAIFADAPDPDAIEQIQQNLAETQRTALARRVDLQQKIAQILTPAQRRQVQHSPAFFDPPPVRQGPPRAR
jgi:Spy/CpxP family protein refolding chaperone